MKPEPYVAPVPLRGRISRSQPRGLPVVNLGFNELPYPPLPSVARAMEEAVRRAQSYGPPHNDALREALAEANGLDPDHIVCGNGSEELLDCLARAFARPGDEVLISEYGYIQFALAANRVGAALVKAPETALATDVDALLAHVSDRTRILFLANPNNPTGTMVEVDALKRLADALPARVLLVLDLAYGEFADPGYCAAVHRLAEGRGNVAVTRTFSKAHGLAGIRVGWVHAPAWLVPVIYAVRGMGTVNAVAQAGATASLAEAEATAARVQEIVDSRARMTGALRQMGYEVAPSHANFLLAAPPGATPERTEALVEHVFDAGGFIVNRTREAGLERYFRFSMGTPAQNDSLLDVLRGFDG
jgi:histidinol-phosphate aminotransferase